MGIRRQLGYPPYYFTVGLTLSHKDEETAVRKAYEVMDILRSGLSEKVQILGPTPKPIARTHNLYHYQILLKYRFEDKLQATLNQVLDWTQNRDNKDLRLTIDNEPQNFMWSILAEIKVVVDDFWYNKGRNKEGINSWKWWK